MKTKTDTFYVIAHTYGHTISMPTFVKFIGTGTTDSWGDAETADRYDTKREAEAEIRRMKKDGEADDYHKAVRVSVVTKVYI